MVLSRICPKTTRYTNGDAVASSSLAFFSESRIRSVCNLLGHTKLRDLIETIATVINARMNRGGRPSDSTIKFRRPSSPVRISEESASSYIRGRILRISIAFRVPPRC